MRYVKRNGIEKMMLTNVRGSGLTARKLRQRTELAGDFALGDA